MMYQTWLIPYVEGTLASAQQEELEARFAEDPLLLRELERLQRALPIIQQALAPISDHSSAAIPESLWPRLQKRLKDSQPQRPRVSLFWRIAFVALIGLLVASALDDRHSIRISQRTDQKWKREWRSAPMVVFHRNNSLETRLAAKLQVRAKKVALERLAAQARYPRL